MASRDVPAFPREERHHRFLPVGTRFRRTLGPCDRLKWEGRERERGESNDVKRVGLSGSLS
jgi:hypothetical protein